MPPNFNLNDSLCDATWNTQSFNGTIGNTAEAAEVRITSDGIHNPDDQNNLNILNYSDICIDDAARIGAGASGAVFKGAVNGGEYAGFNVAVKKIKVDDQEKQGQVVTEIKGLLKARQCPNCVQLLTASMDMQKQQCHIVLQFFDKGNLNTLFKYAEANGPGSIPENVLACVAYQSLNGMAFLHANYAIHRDVKPENILINAEGHVAITDFGISKDIDGTMGAAQTYIGTSNYMSPERMTSDAYAGPSDIWGLGLVYYELFTGTKAFAHAQSSMVDLYDAIVGSDDEPIMNLPPDVDAGGASVYSDDAVSFIAKCLNRIPEQRHTAADLVKSDPLVLTACSPKELAQWMVDAGI